MSGPYYLVIAGSLPEAKEWAFQQGLPLRPGRDNGWNYVTSASSFRGARGTVVFVDGYQRRNDLSAAMSMAFELVAQGRLKEWPNE